MDANEQPKRPRRRRRRPEPATLHDFVRPNVKILNQTVDRSKLAASPDAAKPTRHTSQTKRRSRIKSAIVRSRGSTTAREELGMEVSPSMRFCVRHLVQTDELEDPDELQDLVDDLTAQFEAFDGFAALRVVAEEDEELEHYEARLEPGDVVVTYDTSKDAGSAFAAYLGKRYGGVELECIWLHDANTVSETTDQRDGNVQQNEPKQQLESNLGQVAIAQAIDEVPSPLLASFLQRLAALQVGSNSIGVFGLSRILTP